QEDAARAGGGGQRRRHDAQPDPEIVDPKAVVSGQHDGDPSYARRRAGVPNLASARTICSTTTGIAACAGGVSSRPIATGPATTPMSSTSRGARPANSSANSASLTPGSWGPI